MTLSAKLLIKQQIIVFAMFHVEHMMLYFIPTRLSERNNVPRGTLTYCKRDEFRENHRFWWK